MAERTGFEPPTNKAFLTKCKKTVLWRSGSQLITIMDSYDKKALSELEVGKLLTSKVDIPGTVRSFLGHENVRELVAVVMSPDATDLDTILLTGQITPEELYQYIKVLPEFDENKRKIFETVQKMMAKFKIELLKCRNSDDVRKTMRSGLNSVIKLQWHLVVENQQTYRNMLMEFFYEMSQIEIFEIFQDFVQKNKTPEMVQAYRDIMSEGEANAMEDKKLEFQPKAYLEAKNELLTYLGNPVYRSRLDSITEKGQLDDKHYSQLKLTMKAGHEAIIALAQYRKINFTTFPFEDAEIAIMGEDIYGEDNKMGFRQTCAVEVCLDPRCKAKLPEPVKLPDGFHNALFLSRPGVIQFVLNRASGELCYISHQTKPISNIMSEKLYLALKAMVYNFLLGYLKTKEPDIDDLFKKSTATTTLREKTGVSIKKALADTEIPGQASGNYSAIPWTYQPWLPAGKELVPNLESEEEKQTHERNTAYVKRFKGIKGSKVLAVITRLLGEPVRISGSHHIFISPRNGIKYPIPIHEADEVKFPVLLASLKKWGVTLEEFNNEI